MFLPDVGAETLRDLADAVETGRLAPPFSAISIQRFAPPERAKSIAAELSVCSTRGYQPAQIGFLLRALADERAHAGRAGDHIELVWSGPELPGASTRDTAVVVRELFASAKRSVLVSGYAVYQGKRVFQALASSMDARPELRVRMFLNVHREPRDGRADAELTREFAERFRMREWPGARHPEVFFDPRALSREGGARACLHAKCIVVDESSAFVTSANFTEAAHERNIEAGIVVRSPAIARALVSQFESLVGSGALFRLEGVGSRA